MQLNARTGPEGEEVAVAHGGWHGGSQRRYDRFDAAAVLGLPSIILAAAARHFDDRPVGAGGAAAPVAAAAPVLERPRPAARKRRRAAADTPPAFASNIVVDNLEDHEVFFDRPSVRRRPAERQRF